VRDPHLQTTEISPASMAGAVDPRERRLVLTVVTDAGSFTHALPREPAQVTIGRARECDLCIDDSKLSRNHAAIQVGPGAIVTLRDLGSSNGTRLGRAKLQPNAPTPLAVGDAIVLGSTMLVLRETSASELVSRSGAAADVLPLASLRPVLERVAASAINVLVLGETGAGKEVVARAIHELSPRAKEPMVCVNCAALSAALLESELFGHERGAFTGAVAAKEGLLEAAGGGTVFLDEVGEMPLELQAKLLRVLEQREVVRVGSVKARPIHARFVAATNRNLEAEAARGGFRSDLFFRLNGFTLAVPPLRERRAEIEPLAKSFAGGTRLARETIALLVSYEWPGNVRELRNAIERAKVLCDDVIKPEHLPERVRRGTAAPSAMPAAAAGTEDGERDRILAALTECAGNQTQAAKLLGISRRTLVTRLGEYDIKRPRKR
jgi:transcriptional regulator with PAS, ATPase and Fis domain